MKEFKLCLVTIISLTFIFLHVHCTKEKKEIDELLTNPIVSFYRTFEGNDVDWGNCVKETSDGNFIFVGTTRSHGAGGYDIWFIKTDAKGDTIWMKTFGGEKNDLGESVQQTSEGGFIVTGSTRSSGAGDYDVWLIKTDTSGNMVWNKTFGGADYDRGQSVQQTSDGGFIIAGTDGSFGAGEENLLLIKTDESGNLIWTRIFGGSGSDWGESARQTSDGGYILIGAKEQSNDVGDIWLIKTDDSGNQLWTKTFGVNKKYRGAFVRETSDGGYILTGPSWAYRGPSTQDAVLIKVTLERR